MSFDDELLKLQRVRRSFLRLSRDLNPEGSWNGETDRRYGKTPDSRGEIPVKGTVERFGTFKNALANHEFPLEIPSIQSDLLDPENEWRSLADRPSNQLLQRRISYHVRQHDDVGAILDQLIAVGQVVSPRFPPGKASLDLSVPGGDFLGEDVPRRLLTVRDWPRSLPDHQGRVIPFIYGSLTNVVPQTTIVSTTTSVPGECECGGAAVGAAIHQLNVPASLAYADDWTRPSYGGYGWGHPGEQSTNPGGPWATYPWAGDLTLRQAGGLRLDPGAGPGGINALTSDYLNTAFNLGVRQSSNVMVTPVVRGFDSYTAGGNTYTNRALYGGWDGRQARFSFYWKIDSALIAYRLANAWDGGNANYLRLTTIAVQGFLSSSSVFGGALPDLSFYFGPNWPGLGPSGGNLNAKWQLNGQFREQAVPMDTWLLLRFDWKASSHIVGSTFDNDGCLRVTITPVGGSEIELFRQDCRTITPNTGLNVGGQDAIAYLETPFSETAPAYNYLNYYAIPALRTGSIAGVSLESVTIGTTVTETEVVTQSEQIACPESDGLSDLGGAGRGGWIKALLVDTGGAPLSLGDYPTPSISSAAVVAQPYAAPTLNASAQAGGYAIAATHYYAIATVHADGQLSELSNVVAVTTAVNDKVVLTWSGLASGATGVRVFRGNGATFLQFDRYRVTGYPYSVSDVSSGESGITDLYPGYDISPDGITTPTGEDPHWDLNYRQTKHYQISALYEDGQESTCSSFATVELQPRNAPLVVRLTWSAPAAGPSPLVGYRVRRWGQIYHYEAGPERQWDLGPTILQLDDPNTDTTPVSACATTALPGNKPIYCLAGHWLKAVREVFVFKPDPTSDTNEFVWVKMTEGVDFTQEIYEINGNRYHCLVFNEQQRSETCQYYEVTANVDGVETNADGTGTLLTNLDDIFEHILLNVVFNTYRSSIGAYAPTGGKYFEDVPYAPGLLDRASIAAARTVGLSMVPSAGPQGAGALAEKINARQLIHDLLVTADLEFYQFQGSWHARRFDPANVVRGSLQHFEPDEGIFKATFEPTIDQTKQVNLIPFFGGPIGGDGSQGYLVSGELRDDTSIDIYRRIIISEPLYLIWTQDAATAYAVVSRYVKRLRYPVLGAVYAAPIKWFTLPPGAEVRVTHPDGLGAGGWSARVCRLLSVDLDFDKLICYITVRDVDDLIP